MPPGWWIRLLEKASITPSGRATSPLELSLRMPRSRRAAGRLSRTLCAAILRTTWNSVRAWQNASFSGGSCWAPCLRGWSNSPAEARVSAPSFRIFFRQATLPGFKSRLLRNLNGSLYDIAMSFGFSRMVPRKGPA